MNKNTPKPEVLVISLNDATARRSFVTAQFQQPNLPSFRFISAVDGRSADANVTQLNDVERSKKHLGRALTGPEIGCSLSHLRAYQTMVDESIEIAVIMEDDVLVGSQFPLVLENITKNIKQRPESPQITLLSHVVRYSSWGSQKLGKHHLLVSPYEAFGAHGYVLNLPAAKLLLSELSKIYTVADDWRHFKQLKGLSLQAVIPYCVGVSMYERGSEIGRERFKEDGFNLYKKLRKYLYQKFLFQLITKPLLRLKSCRPSW